MAFAFTPQPPIVDWLKDLDAALERSKGFFADRPVALDLSAVQLSPSAITHRSVGSGAEIVAGGSIHVYGALRGRAIAGAAGNPRARIFCHRVEAELLAIDCYYKTVDDIDDSLRHRPAQIWLEGGTVKISAMN
jgi:septum site-determining protein MinC